MKIMSQPDQHMTDFSRPKTPRDYLRLFLTGVAMGAADIVPGVSGGTMAFILGIYETLLNAIKSFNPTALRLALARRWGELFEHVPVRFLIPLALGIGVAILGLAGALNRILDDPTGRIYLFAFFFGLIIASIIAVSAQVRWNATAWAALLIGAAAAFIIVNLLPVDAPHDPLSLFLSGAVAICAMILPGISGSFILLILGQYDYVLSAVSERNIAPLIFVAAGCAVGILLFARLLSWMLKHYYTVTVAALVGFMVGSLWKIWPWKACVLQDLDRHGEMRCLAEQNLLPDSAQSLLLALGLALAGFVLVSVIDHLQSRANPIVRRVWKNGNAAQTPQAPTQAQ